MIVFDGGKRIPLVSKKTLSETIATAIGIYAGRQIDHRICSGNSVAPETVFVVPKLITQVAANPDQLFGSQQRANSRQRFRFGRHRAGPVASHHDELLTVSCR